MKTSGVILFLLILASTSVGQNIVRKGKLPKDFQLIVDETGTVQYANYRRYIIRGNGKVTFEYTRQGLPIGRPFSDLILIPSSGNSSTKAHRPKTASPVKKEKLSKRQVIRLAQAIDSSTFFEMQDRYYGNPLIEEGSCTNHASANAITVAANGSTKTVYFFLGCTYGDFTPLKRFSQLYDLILKAISSVRMKELSPQPKS